MRLLVLLTLLIAAAFAQTDVLTANYGNDRTNANLRETILNTANVNPAQFGKLASLPVDGQIYAQPLYSRGIVYVATMHNSVYAFDATNLSSPISLWRANLGTAVPSISIGARDTDPEVGILSTPVIDPATNTLYAVAASLENDDPVYRLHALDLATGLEKFGGPVLIQARVSGIGDASANGLLTLDATQHLQRTGLLLANGAVYIGFGSIRDRLPYHGWILAYDASTLQQKAVFNVTPDGGSGGVWQAGRGLAADSNGNLYVVTGNGDYDGVRNFGESFVKLSPDLRVLDRFAPSDWQELSDIDGDLGSLGAMLVPNADLVLGGDKVNNLYAVNRRNMANPQILQPLAGGGFYNAALWPRGPDPLLYMIEPGDWTGSFRIAGGQVETAPFSQTPVAPDWPFSGMAVSADGSAEGSGILWVTAGDHEASFAAPPGTLLAFDALDLTNLLWTSDMNPETDYPGIFAKFANPTVADGLVFVPTFSHSVAVYGLLP